MSLDVRIKNGTSENVPSPDAEENEINIIEEIKNSQNQSSISQDNGINMLLLRRLQLLSPLLFPSMFSIPVLLFIVLIISSALGEFSFQQCHSDVEKWTAWKSSHVWFNFLKIPIWNNLRYTPYHYQILRHVCINIFNLDAYLH